MIFVHMKEKATINKLMQYCIGQYHTPKKCRSCVNDRQCSASENCYKICIYKVHRIANKSLHYNCPNMLFCYIMKHFYRYASEIESIFERFFYMCHSHIRVASIGCGPASEFYGITDFLENNTKCKLTFDYTGLDIDDFWQPIWDYTQENFKNAQFIKSDFFEYYNEHELPEVVVVNYMLSDMAKYNPDGINDFLDNLVDFLNAMPYGVIIINDINYEKDTTETAYGCLHYLHEKIKSLPDIEIHSGSFTKLPISQKYFGKRIVNDSIRTKMIDIPFDIQPFNKCNSIQYIIIKHQSEEL